MPASTPTAPAPPVNARAVCFHCGQDLPSGATWTVEIDQQTQPMCCRGCQAVAQAIVASGLEDYYRFRTDTVSRARDPVPDILRESVVYDDPVVQKSFVHQTDDRRREASLILEGLVCPACVWLNEKHLAQLPGVLSVAINFSTHRARVCWDPARLPLSRILQAVAEIGYAAHPYDPRRAQDLYEADRRLQLRRLAVAAGFGMQVMILAVALYAGAFGGMESEFRNLFHWLSLVLCLPVLFYSAQPFYRGAWRDLRRGHAGMDVPVVLGLTLALLGSGWSTITARGDVYFDSIVMFVFFLLTGRYFELAGRKRAAEVSESMVRMLPVSATRLDGDRLETVPASRLAQGDRVLVRPGESIPADGQVITGRSSVDESLLTGESLPRVVEAGATLIGGSVNIESPLTLRVDKTGEDMVLAAILRLLDRAQSEKPAITAAADRAASWFVLVVLLLAMGVALYWYVHAPERWLPITLAVLVVTCPCALSLATPAAMTAATGRLMRHGLVTTRAQALETLARADTFVFDKTGTLTHGRLQLKATQPCTSRTRDECLMLAAALERHSEHPIALALRRAAPESQREARDVRNVPGAGLHGRIDNQDYYLGTASFLRDRAGLEIPEAQLAELQQDGQTLVLLADADRLLAAFVLSDEPRPGARALITALRQQGRRVLLLTGDHRAAAARIAHATGIDEVEAGLGPQDKLARVQEMTRSGAIVAMVGDGVNDAAALAAAHVSIAMGGGTQIAAASADMVLLSGHLPYLAEAVGVAARTLRIIHQNLVWAIVYNLVALPFAMTGLIAPWMAALGMSASSLLVVLNALRLGADNRPATPSTAVA